jgi:hypothetical protein
VRGGGDARGAERGLEQLLHRLLGAKAKDVVGDDGIVDQPIEHKLITSGLLRETNGKRPPIRCRQAHPPLGEGIVDHRSRNPSPPFGILAGDDDHVGRDTERIERVTQANHLLGSPRELGLDDEEVEVASLLGLPARIGAEENDPGVRRGGRRQESRCPGDGGFVDHQATVARPPARSRGAQHLGRTSPAGRSTVTGAQFPRGRRFVRFPSAVCEDGGSGLCT